MERMRAPTQAPAQGFRAYAQPEQLAAIFYHREAPQFVLNPDGQLLDANLAARRLIELRILNHTPDFRLLFGSAAVNARAQRCLEACAAGAPSARMLKRHDGTEWLIFEFHPVSAPTPTGVARHVVLGVRLRADPCAGDMGPVVEAMGLTDQEARVAACMCQAMSAKEIGRELGISPNTVRAHLRAIYAKCGERGYHNTLRLLISLLG